MTTTETIKAVLIFMKSKKVEACKPWACQSMEKLMMTTQALLSTLRTMAIELPLQPISMMEVIPILDMFDSTNSLMGHGNSRELIWTDPPKIVIEIVRIQRSAYRGMAPISRLVRRHRITQLQVLKAWFVSSNSMTVSHPH